MKMDPSHKALTLSPMEKVSVHLAVQEICHLDGQTEVENYVYSSKGGTLLDLCLYFSLFVSLTYSSYLLCSFKAHSALVQPALHVHSFL